jgi:hypothetical protein
LQKVGRVILSQHSVDAAPSDAELPGDMRGLRAAGMYRLDGFRPNGHGWLAAFVFIRVLGLGDAFALALQRDLPLPGWSASACWCGGVVNLATRPSSISTRIVTRVTTRLLFAQEL